jgi:hypothetical protein
MTFDGKEFNGPGGVNVANLLALADVVEKSATFNMERVHECGTPACIAGHGLALFGSKLRGEGWGLSQASDDFLQLKLGLSQDQTSDLFEPEVEDHGVSFWASVGEFEHITNAHAAACLRKLAATGVVDWIGTKPALSKAAQSQTEDAGE